MKLANNFTEVKVLTQPLQVLEDPAVKRGYNTDEPAVSKIFPNLVGWRLQLEAVVGIGNKKMPDGTQREIVDTKEIRVTMWLPKNVDLSTKLSVGDYIRLDPEQTVIGSYVDSRGQAQLYFQSLGFATTKEAK